MKYLYILMLMFFCARSYAVEVTPGAVPANLHVYSTNGATYVDLVAQGCSGSRYYLSPNHMKYDTVVALLLAAQMASREVVVRFDGCINGSNPQGNVIGVYLK